MMYHRKNLERKERRNQRMAREDAAGRLSELAPDLTDLHLEIDETQKGGSVGGRRYIRRIVIEQAPALFEVPCSDPHCETGGYDLTREILAALASRRKVFEGQQSCAGECGRAFHYVATATYRGERSVEPAVRTAAVPIT
jgi:hypothetical protein